MTKAEQEILNQIAQNVMNIDAMIKQMLEGKDTEPIREFVQVDTSTNAVLKNM